jgi:hypothetical protein
MTVYRTLSIGAWSMLFASDPEPTSRIRNPEPWQLPNESFNRHPGCPIPASRRSPLAPERMKLWSDASRNRLTPFSRHCGTSAGRDRNMPDVRPARWHAATISSTAATTLASSGEVQPSEMVRSIRPTNRASIPEVAAIASISSSASASSILRDNRRARRAGVQVVSNRC